MRHLIAIAALELTQRQKERFSGFLTHGIAAATLLTAGTTGTAIAVVMPTLMMLIAGIASGSNFICTICPVHAAATSDRLNWKLAALCRAVRVASTSSDPVIPGAVLTARLVGRTIATRGYPVPSSSASTTHSASARSSDAAWICFR